MADPPPNDWNDSRKAALVEDLLLRKLTLHEACERHKLSSEQLKDWVRIFRRAVLGAVDDQLRTTLCAQGLEIDELSTGALSGRIGDISVADLIQTMAMGKKSARISVSHRGHDHTIWSEDGEVVDARSLAVRGKEAVYRIIAMGEGQVAVSFSAKKRKRTIDTPTQGLLLAAADRATLHAKLTAQLGGRQCRFQLSSTSPAEAPTVEEEELLGLLANAPRLQRLQELSSLGDVPTLRILQKLVSSECVEVAAVEPSPSSDLASQRRFSSPSLFRVTRAPHQRRPPVWLLAGGAAICTGMGAASAITYLKSVRDTPLPNTNVERSDPNNNCPAGMALIRAGTFRMGTNSSSPSLSLATPAHPVKVSAFCIATHETTVESYDSCVNVGKCSAAHQVSANGQSVPPPSSSSQAAHNDQCNTAKSDRSQHPINCVSHSQATSFCSWKNARLPSEAEWEFAARGTENRPYPWGRDSPEPRHLNACGTECTRWHAERRLENELQGQAYGEDDGYASTAPVGSFHQGGTPEGVHDLLGNVFEWTSGGLYVYPTTHRTEPQGPAQAGERVIRGGNFKSGLSDFTNPSVRFAVDSRAHSHGIGFRCAVEPRPNGLAMNP